MTARTNYIGGKTRRAKDRPPKPQPAGQIIVTCDECQAQYLSAVEIGRFVLLKSCDCGAVIKLEGRYDGYNVFPGHSTIEQVTP